MLLIIVSFVIILLVFYLRQIFSYWSRKNIPSYPSPSLVVGNMRKSTPEQMMDFYKYFKNKGFKHGGFYLFHQPIYMPIAPELIKHIITQDYEHFNEKGLYTNEKHQPINMHLFQLGGDRWKKLRIKLTPTFTSGKLKNMFSTIADCANPMLNKIEEYNSANLEIDIKDISSKFTTDVIGSCAFGIECNSFASCSSDFHKMGTRLIKPTTWRTLRRAISMSYPKICNFFGVVLMPREVEQFYTKITTENLKYRQENNVKRNDFLQLLMELLNKENANERITVQEIICQSFVFYIAGFETSSSVMSFALLELAKHTHMQDKVRKEINDTLEKHNGIISYDSIKEMKYLGLVIDETLRKYPPVITLNRECSKDYNIPETDIILEKGTKVFIPVLPMQFDAEFYPEPEKFDPERFTEENKRLRHPYSYLPFGEGPRQCIGLRFGLLQTKIGLVTLLRKFKFDLHPSTAYPVEFENSPIALVPKHPVLLTSSKIM